jgi:hypothetical protein
MSELKHAELTTCWTLLIKTVHGNLFPYICASRSHLSLLTDKITTPIAARVIRSSSANSTVTSLSLSFVLPSPLTLHDGGTIIYGEVYFGGIWNGFSPSKIVKDIGSALCSTAVLFWCGHCCAAHISAVQSQIQSVPMYTLLHCMVVDVDFVMYVVPNL